MLLAGCNADPDYYNHKQWRAVIEDADTMCTDRGGVRFLSAHEGLGWIQYKAECGDDATIVTKTIPQPD